MYDVLLDVTNNKLDMITVFVSSFMFAVHTKYSSEYSQ